MKTTLLLLALLGMQTTQASEGAFVKTREGCSLMLEVINTVDSVSWSGKCVDGRAEGVGIATYVNGASKISFIEEYMEGVRAYPYAVDKRGAVRLGGGPESGYITLSVCKKLDECTALADYAAKSKRFASLDNRIGKDIEAFGRATILFIIGGGKPVYTQHPQGQSVDFDYSGVEPSRSRQEPTLTSSTSGAGKNAKGVPASHLSIINLCFQGAGCGMHFLHYEKGEDPHVITPGYYSRTNGSRVTLSYLVKDCSVGWTANVGGANQNPERRASALICGAASAERALTAGFEGCSKKGAFDCKRASIIDVQWGYWDGNYIADPNPEYERKSKGSPNSVGGTGGGGCRLYDQNLQSCDQYRSIMKSVGVGI